MQELFLLLAAKEETTTTRRGGNERSMMAFSLSSTPRSLPHDFSPFLPQLITILGAHMTTFHAAAPSRVSFCAKRDEEEREEKKEEGRKRAKKALLDQKASERARELGGARSRGGGGKVATFFLFVFLFPRSFSLAPLPAPSCASLIFPKNEKEPKIIPKNTHKTSPKNLKKTQKFQKK